MASKEVKPQVQVVSNCVDHKEADTWKNGVQKHTVCLQLKNGLAQSEDLLILSQYDCLLKELAAFRVPVDLLISKTYIAALDIVNTAVGIIYGYSQGSAKAELGCARLKQIESEDCEWLNELLLARVHLQLVHCLLHTSLYCIRHGSSNPVSVIKYKSLVNNESMQSPCAHLLVTLHKVTVILQSKCMWQEVSDK